MVEGKNTHFFVYSPNNPGCYRRIAESYAISLGTNHGGFCDAELDESLYHLFVSILVAVETELKRSRERIHSGSNGFRRDMDGFGAGPGHDGECLYFS